MDRCLDVVPWYWVPCCAMLWRRKPRGSFATTSMPAPQWLRMAALNVVRIAAAQEDPKNGDHVDMMQAQCTCFSYPFRMPTWAHMNKHGNLRGKKLKSATSQQLKQFFGVGTGMAQVAELRLASQLSTCLGLPTAHNLVTENSLPLNNASASNPMKSGGLKGSGGFRVLASQYLPMSRTECI